MSVNDFLGATGMPDQNQDTEILKKIQNIEQQLLRLAQSYQALIIENHDVLTRHGKVSSVNIQYINHNININISINAAMNPVYGYGGYNMSGFFGQNNSFGVGVTPITRPVSPITTPTSSCESDRIKVTLLKPTESSKNIMEESGKEFHMFDDFNWRVSSEARKDYNFLKERILTKDQMEKGFLGSIVVETFQPYINDMFDEDNEIYTGHLTNDRNEVSWDVICLIKQTFKEATGADISEITDGMYNGLYYTVWIRHDLWLITDGNPVKLTRELIDHSDESYVNVVFVDAKNDPEGTRKVIFDFTENGNKLCSKVVDIIGDHFDYAFSDKVSKNNKILHSFVVLPEQLERGFLGLIKIDTDRVDIQRMFNDEDELRLSHSTHGLTTVAVNVLRAANELFVRATGANGMTDIGVTGMYNNAYYNVRIGDDLWLLTKYTLVKILKTQAKEYPLDDED